MPSTLCQAKGLRWVVKQTFSQSSRNFSHMGKTKKKKKETDKYVTTNCDKFCNLSQHSVVSSGKGRTGGSVQGAPKDKL